VDTVDEDDLARRGAQDQRERTRLPDGAGTDHADLLD
jgi:hypothetical protein